MKNHSKITATDIISASLPDLAHGLHDISARVLLARYLSVHDTMIHILIKRRRHMRFARATAVAARLCRFGLLKICKRLPPRIVAIDPIRIGGALEPRIRA